MDTAEVPTYDDGLESPTQVNEGRSYDRYEDPASLPSNSLRPTQDAGNDFLDRSLDENESGAVKFGSIHSMELDFESPTAAHDDERRRNNGLSRFFPNSDNDPATTTTDNLDPETPAPPKNPFAGKFQTPLVVGSQLFAATPFSAVFNQASPTSSRPSPSELLQQPVTTTPHTGLSSPVKHRFSNLGEQTPMPAVLFHTLSTSSTSRFDGTTPYLHKSAGSPTAGVPQSSPTTRRRRTPAPITEYESMRKSQERREAAAEARPELAGGYVSSSEDEADDARRQRIVRQKKEEATRILSAVSMPGATFRGDIVEVPASVKKDARPRLQGRLSVSRVLEICPESDPPVSTEPAAAAAVAAPMDPSSGLRSSEAYDDASFPQSIIDRPTPEILPGTKTPSSSAALPEMPLASAGQGRPALLLKSSLNETDAIPETSPIGKWPLAVTISREIVPSTSDAVEAPADPASSMPEPALPSQKRELLSLPVYGQQKRYEQAEEVVSLLKQAARQDLGTDVTTSSPPVPTSPARSIRQPQRKRARYGAENDGRNSGRASLATSVSSVDRSASSLSDLSVTPTQLSREGTPITANDSDLSARGSNKRHYTSAATGSAAASEGHSGGDDDDLPLVPRRRRRHGESPSLSLPNIKPRPEHGSTRASRSVKPAPSPIPSASTDELSASPALLTAPGRDTRSSRRSTRSMGTKPSALASTSLHAQPYTAPGLFTGMVFAVSFQSRGQDEASTETTKHKKKSLESRIQDAGGRVLPDGFEDIFRPPPTATGAGISTSSRSRLAPNTTSNVSGNELQLLPNAADSGFTALIVDGHSRKAKYMQALALGLPCLAPRWVTTCLDRGELVDWTPYLLCAGESAFLGGAVRSRNLIPYDASTARLADVVERRKLLLDGLAILFVPGKASKETTFLAHVLGARLSLAQSIQEAREHLKAMEDAGRPYDWVYTGQEKEVAGLFGDRVRPAAKKRKRPPSGDDIDRGSAPVKTLSVERLIQSLIFGELIEQDDFGGPTKSA